MTRSNESLAASTRNEGSSPPSPRSAAAQQQVGGTTHLAQDVVGAEHVRVAAVEAVGAKVGEARALLDRVEGGRGAGTEILEVREFLKREPERESNCPACPALYLGYFLRTVLILSV